MSGVEIDLKKAKVRNWKEGASNRVEWKKVKHVLSRK